MAFSGDVGLHRDSVRRGFEFFRRLTRFWMLAQIPASDDRGTLRVPDSMPCPSEAIRVYKFTPAVPGRFNDPSCLGRNLES